MKKKPLAPRARILWVSALHQLGIPGRCPQSQQHPPAPGTDLSRAGPIRAASRRSPAPRRARGRHFPPERPRSAPAPGRAATGRTGSSAPRLQPSPSLGAAPALPPTRRGSPLPLPLGLCERGAKKLKEEGGCSRYAASSPAHPEPAAVVALMEPTRSRLAASFRACRVCWSGLW